MRRLSILGAALVLVGCDAPPAPPRVDVPNPPPPGRPASATTTTPDAWEGRWNGPEGLFLQIGHRGGDAYELTLKDNLDSQAVYGAKAEGDGLRFTRGGIVQTIRPGTGAQTGFKYLAEKRDCLIVIVDKEGYCRD